LITIVETFHETSLLDVFIDCQGEIMKLPKHPNSVLKAAVRGLDDKALLIG
jgi:hypothetical protein